MFSNETELKDDVRQFTGYTSPKVLSNDGLDTAYRTARRHIRREKSLTADFSWYDSDKVAEQDALYWFTCLFSKVQTGELDSQEIQAGAVELDTLLAKDDDDVTTWYRNAHRALASIKSATIFQTTSPSRTEREYEPASFSREGGDGGSTDDVSL